jgi:hypothetical protein
MRGLVRLDAHLARVNDLLARIKVKLPQLEELLALMEDRSGEEDGVYRFYHQSFKVFDLQKLTLEGLKLIEEIGGETDPHAAVRLSITQDQMRNRHVQVRMAITYERANHTKTKTWLRRVF